MAYHNMYYYNIAPVLYSYWDCPCSYRVRLALNFKRIKHILAPIDLRLKQQNLPEFEQLNLMQQVPVLQYENQFITLISIHCKNSFRLRLLCYVLVTAFLTTKKFYLKLTGDINIVESLAIMNFLEENFPGHRSLYPTDLKERAQVREICYMICATIQPPYILNLLDLSHPEAKRHAKHCILNGLYAIEIILRETANKYCVGNYPTMADCCLIPLIDDANRLKIDLRPYPTIRRVFHKLKFTSAVREALPTSHPGYPRRPWYP